jgi:predicted chitinase
MTNFDRKTYFDSVRASLWGGSIDSERCVEGQEAILGEWEVQPWSEPMTDTRWLAYMLATTYHETSKEMWPIEEYNKGAGQPYGEKDPETGQTYYGRGYVQLTWRDNYQRATSELGLKGEADLEWHADMALEPQIAADIMFRGMDEGWFRSDSSGRQTLARYFSASIEDAYTAREIINGDKQTVPSWSNGVSIGNLIKGYYGKFLTALNDAATELPPEPEPEPQYASFISSLQGYGHKVDVVIDESGVFVAVDGEQIVT